jgi:transposase InsO family protein
VKFAFIHRYRAEFDLTILCRVLAVSRAGYYQWRKRQEQPPTRREMANQQLTGVICTAFARSRGTYGAPRIHAELTRSGVRRGRNRVARLMRRAGFQARRRRRTKVRTTTSQHGYPVAANTLNRQFTATGPNQKWIGDITYIPTREGWLYLAALLDLYSRKVVGWALEPHLEQELVTAALQMALVQRQPRAGVLHHSDRGSQYAAHAYQQLLAEQQLQVSMSRTGNCYDNAVMESFFATLKAECVTGTFATRAHAWQTIFEYIEVWYNRQRRHSTLGYTSPEMFEQQYALAHPMSTKSG